MYQLEINLDEVSRYLGSKGKKLDDKTLQDIQVATIQLRPQVQYKYQYKVFDLTKHDDYIQVNSTNLKLEGKAIKSLLKDCDSCILLAVTLGQNVESLLRRLQITNLAQAVITDFCASSMIENLCSQINDELSETYKAKALFLTDRFSPGYADLPLDVQLKFCEVLDTAKKMGLNVTSSGLMIPRKSITAIIGIAKNPQKMKIKGCKYCDFYKDCEYRKGGKVCD